MCTEKVCRKCARRNCAEIVHTKMCRKCAHTKCAELCTHTKCAKVCAESFAQICHEEVFANVCAELCPRIVSTQKFSVMHNRKFYTREHFVSCVQKFSVMICANCPKMYMSENVSRLSHVQNVKNGPKMTKNDQN